jgi:hypothetical protein
VRSKILLLVVMGAATGCDCRGRLKSVEQGCEADPELCPMAAVDSGSPERDSGFPVDSGFPEGPCDTGTVSGRVCAPDKATWVNGATVTVDATDCHGHPVHLTTTSAADGTFTLDGVPGGSQTVHAALGDFSQDTAVAVMVNQTTQIPDNQLCVAQGAVKIAVITAAGDKIESLLMSLSLQYTLFAGDGTSWASTASPFLSDLTQMKQYDIIFFDCAAAHVSSSGAIDLGTHSAQISQNLAAYVAQGGSIYASDWALVFPLLASPGSFDFLLNGGGAPPLPLPTKRLMGYAPQTVTATIAEPQLATFLGKSQVSITFPKQTTASSLHWGLLQNVSSAARVLVAAPMVQACETTDTNCTSAGMTVTSIPLAVEVKVTPATQRGGKVVYTSFHNIAQSGDDVAKILKYLVLHL